MIIIGSTALKYHNVPFREPSDVDIFSTIWNQEGVEGLDNQIISGNIYYMIPHICGNATPDAVYTIKLSHLPWNIHELDGVWEKHYRDVQYLKKIGCKLIEPLFQALLKHWTQKNGNKEFLNMELTKEEFFNDYVEYKYEHDYLHKLLACPEEPVYIRCVRNGQEIDIDKELFDNLCFSDKIEFFREEIGVIAVERWLIHRPTPLVVAWCNAVKKTITTLTKGWMSEFIVRNIEHFIKPNRDDFKHIFNTLNLKENDMNKMTNEQVQALKEEINPLFVDWQGNLPPVTHIDGYWQDLLLGSTLNSPDYQFIKQEGGYEGGAEYCETVFKWKDTHYKVIFSYASYQGFYLEDADWYVVTPKQQVVTIYN